MEILISLKWNYTHFRVWLYEEPLHSSHLEVSSVFIPDPVFHQFRCTSGCGGVCGLESHSEPQNNCFGTAERGGEEDEEHLCCRRCWTQCAESHSGVRPGFGCQQDFTLNASVVIGDRKWWVTECKLDKMCMLDETSGDWFLPLQSWFKAVWIWMYTQRS